jgi:hypothetical protein
MRLRPLLFVLTGLLLSGLLLGPLPAAAQSENVTTVDGPNSGETTTLTARPYAVAEGLSVRAFGISSPDSTRWGLRFIGAGDQTPIQLLRAGEPLSITDIDRPAEDEIGPTSVYIGQDAFLLMAETSTVTIQVGDVRAEVPDALRAEMQQIFETVTDG